MPGKYTGKTYPILKSFGKILREEWQNDGSWVALVELPAGLRDEFLDELNKITHGNVEAKLVKSR